MSKIWVPTNWMSKILDHASLWFSLAHFDTQPNRPWHLGRKEAVGRPRKLKKQRNEARTTHCKNILGCTYWTSWALLSFAAHPYNNRTKLHISIFSLIRTRGGCPRVIPTPWANPTFLMCGKQEAQQAASQTTWIERNRYVLEGSLTRTRDG